MLSYRLTCMKKEQRKGYLELERNAERKLKKGSQKETENELEEIYERY